MEHPWLTHVWSVDDLLIEVMVVRTHVGQTKSKSPTTLMFKVFIENFFIFELSNGFRDPHVGTKKNVGTIFAIIGLDSFQSHTGPRTQLARR